MAVTPPAAGAAEPEGCGGAGVAPAAHHQPLAVAAPVVGVAASTQGTGVTALTRPGERAYRQCNVINMKPIF